MGALSPKAARFPDSLKNRQNDMNEILGLLGIVVCAFAVGAMQPGAAAQTGEEYEVFRLVNAERARRRLGSLEWDEEIARVARNYSRQMARENFFGHYDGKGRTVSDRASDARWSKIGENLFTCTGMDDFTAFSVSGWMKSPSHRTNILDREWTETGIGVHRTRDGEVFVTQVFLMR